MRANDSARARVAEEVAVEVLQDEARRKAFEVRCDPSQEMCKKRLCEGRRDGLIVAIGMRPLEPNTARPAKVGAL